MENGRSVFNALSPSTVNSLDSVLSKRATVTTFRDTDHRNYSNLEAVASRDIDVS